MKTKPIKTTSAGILLGMILALTSCEKNSANNGDENFAPFLETAADGTSSILQENMLRAFSTTMNPTANEINIITAMREEEKLARDVYTALSEKWGHFVFKRISAAEGTHLEAANSLMLYYGSPDTIITESGFLRIKRCRTCMTTWSPMAQNRLEKHLRPVP